ncbi:hypothetical protein KY343_05375 [Candidatus Woesearchaeota archaeon]|nr:hypothetical protein [Candidatus Woesearchaeota archaeon]
MKKYRLRSAPKTEIELPEKPLELVVEELQGASEFIASNVFKYIQNPRGSYRVTYNTSDSDGNPIVVREIERADVIARNLITSYLIDRFNKAVKEKVIDEKIADTSKDPFLFMTDHFVFDIYKKICLLKKPELFANVFHMFQEGIDYHYDGFTVSLALAYSEKKGKPAEDLNMFFNEQILKRRSYYSFLLDSLIYFSSDEKENEAIH